MGNTISKSRLWTARVMSWIVIVFMLMDGVFKLIQPEEVVTTTLGLGYAEHQIAIIGILALISILLYAYPRTSILGALLLTGFFGWSNRYKFQGGKPAFFSRPFPGLSGRVGLGRTLAEG